MRRNERWNVPGRSASAALAALIATGFVWGEDAPPTELVVVRNGTTLSVPVSQSRGYPTVPASALAYALGYEWVRGTIQMQIGPVQFFDESPFFAVGDLVYQLPNSVYRSGPHLMIPLSWAVDWLPRTRPLRWRVVDGRLVEGSFEAARRPKKEDWLVVIDPGHGGPDPGTIGVRGVKEKHITLAIARRLAVRLRSQPGVTVVLTRDRDTLIALADRPKIARMRGINRPPDLFLSIHGNSMPSKPHPTRGFETYFLAVAKTEEARRVALRENESLRFEGSHKRPEDLDPLQHILSDLQVAGNLRESSLFASSISRSLRAALAGPDLGVKQAPFWVLVGANMPATLVEVGYLSNSSEARMLRSPSYQAKIADALADAVANYLAEYGRRVWSSPESGR